MCFPQPGVVSVLDLGQQKQPRRDTGGGMVNQEERAVLRWLFLHDFTTDVKQASNIRLSLEETYVHAGKREERQKTGALV